MIPTNTENVCTPPRQGQGKPASAQRWALLSGASDGRIDDARAVNRSRGPARIEMREQFPLQPEQTERLIERQERFAQNSPGNLHLLAALPPSNLKHLMPELEFIRCHRDQVLMDADSSLDYVFFPETGVVSVVAVYADGSIIEMGRQR